MLENHQIRFLCHKLLKRKINCLKYQKITLTLKKLMYLKNNQFIMTIFKIKNQLPLHNTNKIINGRHPKRKFMFIKKKNSYFIRKKIVNNF